jgi:hypothetical protein
MKRFAHRHKREEKKESEAENGSLLRNERESVIMRELPSIGKIQFPCGCLPRIQK